MSEYSVIISKETMGKCDKYIQLITEDPSIMGSRLYTLINDYIGKITPPVILDLLLKTKYPIIFAESEMDYNKWNVYELSILGDISIHMNVSIFDNGLHTNPIVYDTPITGNLVFVPGALMRNDSGETPIDSIEIFNDGQFDYDQYYSLYVRRLYPIMQHINKLATINEKIAMVTIPGIGCGMFSGDQLNHVSNKFEMVIIKLLTEYNKEFNNIGCVYLDTYDKCNNNDYIIGNMSLYTRPLTQGNNKYGQLTHPCMYKNIELDVSEMELYSLVAWDHVSYPGNDFYDMYRSTDDGVKAAASNSMSIITGVDGFYDMATNKYSPIGYRTWSEVVSKNSVDICICNNLNIY